MLILISNTGITQLEEDLIDKTSIAATKKNKTQSQRIRSVIFRCFEQSGETDFEQFYKNETEKIIDSYKLGLD